MLPYLNYNSINLTLQMYEFQLLSQPEFLFVNLTFLLCTFSHLTSFSSFHLQIDFLADFT